jgi:hypothetical protein
MDLFFTWNMSTSVESASFPHDLPLARASFYSKGSSAGNIRAGERCGYEYVAFDYDSQSGEMSHAETVVAIKASSPTTPETNLSRASGLQLERVGEWIFAFEVRRVVSRSEVGGVVDDIINLLEYAKRFPQNT